MFKGNERKMKLRLNKKLKKTKDSFDDGRSDKTKQKERKVFHFHHFTGFKVTNLTNRETRKEKKSHLLLEYLLVYDVSVCPAFITFRSKGRKSTFFKPIVLNTLKTQLYRTGGP